MSHTNLLLLLSLSSYFSFILSISDAAFNFKRAALSNTFLANLDRKERFGFKGIRNSFQFSAPSWSIFKSQFHHSVIGLRGGQDRNPEYFDEHTGGDGDKNPALRAIESLERFRSAGLPLNISTYNDAIRECWRGGRWDLSLDLYESILKEGLKPNKITFNAVLGACARGGQHDKAEQIFSEMTARKIGADDITYNAMIISLARVGRWRKGLEYFHLMRKNGLAPNRLTYNSLIAACASASQLPQALQIFDAMSKAGVKADTTSCNAVLSALCGAGEWQEVVDFSLRFQREGVEADKTTYNGILVAQAMLAAADPGRAEAAHGTFEEMRRRGHAPDALSYTALMAAFANAGMEHRALRVQEAMREAGFDPESDATLAPLHAAAAQMGGEEGAAAWPRECAHVQDDGSWQLN